jgi:hypothetical protein
LGETVDYRKLLGDGKPQGLAYVEKNLSGVQKIWFMMPSNDLSSMWINS